MKKDKWGYPRGSLEGNFRLIFGRMEIDARIRLFRSMAVRSALPSIYSWQRFLGRFLEGVPEVVSMYGDEHPGAQRRIQKSHPELAKDLRFPRAEAGRSEH